MFYGLLDLRIVQYAAAGLLFSNDRQSHTNIDRKEQPALPLANADEPHTVHRQKEDN